MARKKSVSEEGIPAVARMLPGLLLIVVEASVRPLIALSQDGGVQVGHTTATLQDPGAQYHQQHSVSPA